MPQPNGPMSPLVVFAGGGTGGHLYPAIALAQALRGRLPGVRYLFLGTDRPVDQQILNPVDAEFIPQTLPVFSVRPWHWPGIVYSLQAACRRVDGRFQSDRPVVVIGTGGMASVPAVVQAHRSGIPVLLLNPDAVPGRANRHLSRWADAIYVQWDEAKWALPKARKVCVLGCPIRSDFHGADRQAGIGRFGLNPSRRVLLITGASQGATTINDAFIGLTEFLASLTSWQILHLTGRIDFERVRIAYENGRVPSVVLAYTDQMAEALAAADLVISRAGASTLAEITAMGKPSILMPYPFHKDQHQTANAECLVRVGAALRVPDLKDATLTRPHLKKALEVLTGDARLRDTMSRAANALGKSDAAALIADDIVKRLTLGDASATCESLEGLCGHTR